MFQQVGVVYRAVTVGDVCSDVSVACCSFGLSRNGSSHFDKVRLAFTFFLFF